MRGARLPNLPSFPASSRGRLRLGLGEPLPDRGRCAVPVDDSESGTPRETSSSPRRASHEFAELGPLLTRLRESRGLLAKQVAGRAGLDASTISRLESGERGASREVIDRLAAALDATGSDYHALLNAAGFLPDQAALLLDDPDFASLSALFTSAALTPSDRQTLRSYITLALRHATALGYTLPEPRANNLDPPGPA